MSSLATRRERVLLELEDRFSGPMAEAAARTALLKRELNGLSGQAVSTSRSNRDLDSSLKSVGDSTDKAAKKTKEYTLEQAMADEKTRRLRKSLQDQAKAALDSAEGIDDAAKKIDSAGNSSNNSAKQIDRLSGRMRLLAEAAFVLGPALLPIGAAAIPAVLGLSAAFGAAAAGAGVAVLAFQGVGDALKALDAYQLEPTAANLETMQQKMDALGPSGQQLVTTLDALEPALKQLQEGAREGLFPGVEEGLSSLMGLLPEVQAIIGNIAAEMGKLAAEAGKGLSGAGFADFFHYLETDAAPTLEAFGHTIGNVAEGFGHLIVAFAPLTRSFSSGMESMSASFAKWADGLSQTNGFRDFVSYVQESGPKVLDLIGALADAFVGIAKAAAPVGNAVLPALTGLLHVFAAIANSPIGPPLYTAAAGMLALSRASTLAATGMGRFGASTATVGRATSGLKALGGAAVGILAVSAAVREINAAARDAMPGVEQMTQQLTNLADSGNAAALSRQFDDLSHDLSKVFNKSTSDSIGDFFYKWSGGQAILGDTQAAQEATDEINALDAALANIVNTQGPEAAAKALQSLADSGAITDEQLKALRQHLPQYDEALAGVANQADSAAASTHGLASVLASADAKIHAARQGALTTAQSFMKFGDSLGDAKVSLSQWLAELRKQAAALQNFTANARTAARRGLDEGLIKSLQEAGPVGAMRMRQLANATDSEIARANRSWRKGQQAIHEYANTVGGVPTAKATTLSVHDLATMKARAIKSELASIDRNIDIYIRAHTTRLPSTSGMGPQITSADGSTVPGPRYPYGDKIHALVAPGEEIISNRYGQADRHRALLKAINANRYAEGGTAGGGRSSRPWVAADGVEALNRAAKDTADHLKKANDHRKKLLEKELERDQHEVDRDKKRHDALVQELKDLQNQRRELMSTVRSQFTTDIFGGGIDLQHAAQSGQLGQGFAQDFGKWMHDNGVKVKIGDDLSGYISQYLDTLSSDQIAALQTQAGIGQLNQDASNADAFEHALKKAKRHGLSGGLLHYLEASGNLGAAQQFASMSRAQIDEYEKAYKNRRYEVNQTARLVGDDRYGAQITAQTKLAEHANRVLERAEAHAKETNQRLHRLEKHMDHLNKTQDKAPRETGREVAGAINGAVAQGTRRGH